MSIQPVFDFNFWTKPLKESPTGLIERAMVFETCLPYMSEGVAKYRAKNSNFALSFGNASIGKMLANPDINMIKGIFISDDELIKGIKAVKKYVPSLDPYMMPEWW